MIASGIRHTLELGVLLLFMVVGHGAVVPAPNILRRTAVSFALWAAAFATIVAVLYSPMLSTWLIRLGAVVLGAYFARTFIGGFLDIIHGPRLFERPESGHLAAIAEHSLQMSRRNAHSAARRLLRRYGPDIALLGLIRMVEAGECPPERQAGAWEGSCQAAMEDARALAREHTRASHDRVHAPDASFVTQALCLYQRKSVLRALEHYPLGSRLARGRTARYLDDKGAHHDAAEIAGLLMPPAQDTDSGHCGSAGIRGILCPPWILWDLGFTRRAVVLGFCEAVLLLYGAYGVYASGVRDITFLWSTPGGVFVALAILVHVEGVFALRDFARLAYLLEGHKGPEGRN